MSKFVISKFSTTNKGFPSDFANARSIYSVTSDMISEAVTTDKYFSTILALAAGTFCVYKNNDSKFFPLQKFPPQSGLEICICMMNLRIPNECLYAYANEYLTLF